MRKMIPFLIAAAVAAPLYLGTPAQAQTINDIQRLEERVNEAKARGNWGAAQDLEVQLNMARLQYQRNNGLGEVNDRGSYNNGYWNNTRGYYPQPAWNNNGRWNNGNNRKRVRDNRRNHQQRGYYDQWGRWRSY